MVAALGTAAAIAQAFGGKNVRAIQAFHGTVSGEGGSTAADSPQMSELRKRIQAVVNMGESE